MFQAHGSNEAELMCFTYIRQQVEWPPSRVQIVIPSGQHNQTFHIAGSAILNTLVAARRFCGLDAVWETKVPPSAPFRLTGAEGKRIPNTQKHLYFLFGKLDDIGVGCAEA